MLTERGAPSVSRELRMIAGVAMERDGKTPVVGPFEEETVPLRRVAVSADMPPKMPPMRFVRDSMPPIKFAGWRPRRTLARRIYVYLRSHNLQIVLTLITLAVAVGASWLLLRMGLATPIASSLRAMDLDEERIALVSQAIVTLGGAFVAAALTRKRLAALIGACIYVLFWYILPFIDHAQHPPVGPGGVMLVPRPGALEQVTLTLVAFGIVAAGAGAALGGAFGALTTAPIITLFTSLWRLARHKRATDRASIARAPLSLALAAVVVFALMVIGSNAGSLLMYGLASNLYRLNTAEHQGKAPLQGSVSLIHFFSPTLGAERNFFIYLPPSYTIATAQRYPTLYILHGSPGGPGDWVQGGKAGEIEDALVTAGKMRETILVTPDGNGPTVRISEWANTYDGRQRMEDAIVSDLVQYVDSHYRTLANAADRAISGNSEGGYGAVNLALHHPEVFSQAASFGGYFEAPTSETGVFGNSSSSATTATLAYNSPSQFIFTTGGNRAAHRVTFYVCVGKSDRVNLYTSGVNFAAKLAQVGAKSQLITSSGAHSWSVWISQLTTTMSLMEPPETTA